MGILDYNADIVGVDSHKIKYYFKRENNTLSLLSKDDEIICSMEIDENNGIYQKGTLALMASGEYDVTAFSAKMDAIIEFKIDKKKKLGFLSERIAQHCIYPKLNEIEVQKIKMDIDNLYSDKELQLKYNFILLHPVCFELDDNEKTATYINLNDINEVTRKNMKNYEVSHINFNDYSINMYAELNRFIIAHNRIYDKALCEIKNGKKESHWIWYIFPQVAGLGSSEMSEYYAIKSVKEANEYINNQMLHEHLIEISNELFKQDTINILDIVNNIDAMKIKSSMTLFSIVDKENEIYNKILNKYFNGEKDEYTIKFIESRREE